MLTTITVESCALFLYGVEENWSSLETLVAVVSLSVGLPFPSFAVCHQRLLRSVSRLRRLALRILHQTGWLHGEQVLHQY